MERRDFLQKTILTTAGVAGTSLAGNAAKAQQKNNEVYEFRVYHMRRNMKPLDNYFSNVLIPALNRKGIKNVGVFSELSKDEPAKIYALIPYKSFADFGRIANELRADKDFASAKSEYDKIPLDQAVYERFDSSLMIAFDGLPIMEVPAKSQQLFELRIYEGYSEDAVKRKVKMFNEGEIDIFRNVKLNPVFFGENIT